MVRRAVLVLAGCNAVFGIKDTRQYDAAYFDAPPDAPFACPALGGPAPTFSPVLHQDVIQDCST